MSTTSKIGGGFILLAVLVLLNLWVFVWGGGSIPEVKNKATAAAIQQNGGRSKELAKRGKSLLNLRVPKALANPEALKRGGSKSGSGEFSEMETRILHGRLRRGDTLYRAFKRLGVGRDVADSVVRALNSIFDFRKARPGQRFSLRITEDKKHILDFEYQATPVKVYRVARVGDRLVGKKVKRPVDTRVSMVAVKVRSNLYNALKEAGGGGKLLNLLVKAFSYDLNFYTDIHVGDVMKMLVEKDYIDGSFYRYGRLLAAQYIGKAGRHEAYWYQCHKGSTGYFDKDGKALRRKMLKTPLKYTRISSHFDKNRFHPVLHRHKAHLGVDFAAPTGTPVWAASDGTVTFVGRNRAAGNMVVLNHTDGMVTVYMHLHRFRRGLSKGDEVRQRQVIGYVGTTGRSTGPHLHFGLKLKGVYVDPMKMKARRAPPVPSRERSTFREIAGAFRRALNALPVPPNKGLVRPADEPTRAAVDVLNRRILKRKKRRARRKSRRSKRRKKNR